MCEIQADTGPTCWTEPEPLVDPTPSTTIPAETAAPTTTTTIPVETPAPTTTTTIPVETPAPTTTTTIPVETPAPTTTTTVPVETDEEPEPEDDEPQYAVGDVVPASELYPDEELPDNLICLIQADGHPTCWTETEDNPELENWVPPQAGMVPDPYPECASDRSTWDQTCIPPSSWDYGEFEPGFRVNETPRATPAVLAFYEECSSIPDAPCDWLLGLMKWPLDYMGARPACVHGEYLERVRSFARTGSAVGEVQNRYGWHNCSTVIDPLVGQLPTETANDVGYRLSDTGLSLAERCRTVLPEDVMLETFYGGRLSDGTRRPPIRFNPGHAGCDEWAEWVNAVIDKRVSYMPDCYRSARLAEEWAEHHYNVHELYIGGFNC